MSDRDEIHARVEAEIVELHNFIAAWFRGEPDNSAAVFSDGFADRVSEDFVNIQPSGQVLSRCDLLDPIKAAYGANPKFQISIAEVVVRHVDKSAGLTLATYVEHQTGARNTNPPANDRISTVLFRLTENGGRPLWLHIHETAQATT